MSAAYRVVTATTLAISAAVEWGGLPGYVVLAPGETARALSVRMVPSDFLTNGITVGVRIGATGGIISLNAGDAFALGSTRAGIYASVVGPRSAIANVDANKLIQFFLSL